MKVFYPRHSREEIIRAVREGVARLGARLPLVEAVLFGSVASGRQTVASDVDLLIVCSGPTRQDVFALAKELVQVPRLEVHAYSELEATQLRETIARMTRGGIRVYPALPSHSEGQR